MVPSLEVERGVGILVGFPGSAQKKVSSKKGAQVGLHKVFDFALKLLWD